MTIIPMGKITVNVEKLARIDLNLLVCFKVLIEELNVTRAAHRLCLSQSAVSKSLAKYYSWIKSFVDLKVHFLHLIC